jgi:hypothetical protein
LRAALFATVFFFAADFFLVSGYFFLDDFLADAAPFFFAICSTKANTSVPAGERWFLTSHVMVVLQKFLRSTIYYDR